MGRSGSSREYRTDVLVALVEEEGLSPRTAVSDVTLGTSPHHLLVSSLFFFGVVSWILFFFVQAVQPLGLRSRLRHLRNNFSEKSFR